MPNWCINKIGIVGSEKDIKHFYSKYLTNFKFNNIIPEPKKAIEVPNKYVVEDARIYYENKKKDELTWMEKHFDLLQWRREKWGTKWDLSQEDIICKKKNESIYLQFSTAWEPPLPIIAKLIEDNPSLQFKCTFLDENYLFAGAINPDQTMIEETNVNKMDDFLKKNSVINWIKMQSNSKKKKADDKAEHKTTEVIIK